MPSGLGKFNATAVGTLEYTSVASFFAAVACAAGVCINLSLVKGDNSHHVIESSFKAFSRCLRLRIDGPPPTAGLKHWGEPSVLERKATADRSTKETSISVELTSSSVGEKRKWPSTDGVVSTGIPAFDDLVLRLFSNAGVVCHLKCSGDLWIDDHHLGESVGSRMRQRNCFGGAETYQLAGSEATTI